MTIQNLIVNGSFETGALPPWVGMNATITSQFSHSGFFSARLQGGNLVSYIAQTVPVNAGEGLEFLVSLAKVGFSPAAPVQIQVIYLDSMSNSLGNGLFTNIPMDRIPTADNDTWLETYQTTTLAPPGATQAFVLINSLPQAGTADILVDDVALLVTGATGGCTFCENAELLDGLNSTEFLRSNISGTLNGDLIINGNLQVNGSFIQFPRLSSAPFACGATTAGSVYFDTTLGKLMVCNGTIFETISSS